MKFVYTNSDLVIILEGREQFAALKAKIIIKRTEIKQLSWVDKFDDWRRWEVRMPGASIPGRIIAGSYWTEEGWDFLYITRPIGIRHTYAIDVICLELKNHEKYQRIIISALKADYLHLNKWLKPNKIKSKKKTVKKPKASTK